MAIDPNIALQVGQGAATPQNPLDMIGKVANTANALAYNKLIKTNTATTDQGLNATRQKAIGTIAMSVLHLPDQEIVPALHGALDRAVKAGVMPAEQAAQYEAGIAQSKDPAHLRRMIAQVGLSTLDPQGQFSQIYGTPSNVNTGGSIVQGVTRPAMQGGGFQPATSMPTTMDPGTAVDLVQVPVMGADGKPTGATEMVTRAEVARRTGQQGAPGTSAFPQGYTGRPAPAAGASTPPAPPSGSLGTTRPPETQTAISAAATDATKSSADLFRAADAANGRRAQLNTMITDLAGLKSTGPGTTGQLQLEAFLQKYAGLGVSLTADEVAKGEAFAKVAKTLAAQQAGALGVTSDQRLMNALGANPSLDLSKRGNSEILAMLKGNEDAIIAKSRAWEDWLKSGKTPDTYNQFQTDFNRKFDPRAFQWHNLYPSLTEAERRKYLDRMPDKEEFRRSYNEAVKNKWIVPGG